MICGNTRNEALTDEHGPLETSTVFLGFCSKQNIGRKCKQLRVHIGEKLYTCEMFNLEV